MELLPSYGLTVEDWDRMLIEHSDRCAICGVAPWVLCIDHDHQTLGV